MTEIMKLGGGGRFILNPAYVNWNGADRTCRPTAMQALFGVAERCAELRADSRYPQPSIRGEYLSAPGCWGAGSAVGCLILARQDMGVSVRSERLKSPQLGIDADPEFIYELLRRHGIDHECFLERDDPGLDPCNQSFSLVGALVRRSKLSWIHETRVKATEAVAWML